MTFSKIAASTAPARTIYRMGLAGQTLLGLCLLPLSAAAEAAPAEPVETLPTLTVEATRMERPLNDVPAAISRIDAASIQRGQRQLTLDESLQEVPGVFILNPDNFAQDTRIAIRGFGAQSDFGIRGIRLIVDGISATTPDGQGQVDGIDFGSADRIEVLRGPASALYGSASGGIIRIESESGPAIPFIETRLSGGEDGFFNAQFKAGGTQGPLNYLLSTSYLDFDGYRDNSEVRGSRINGKLEYSLSEDARLRLVFNLIDFSTQQDPGGLTRAEAKANPRQARQQNLDFDGGESVSQQRVGLTHLWDLSDAHSLESRIQYTHRDFSNKLPFQNGGQVAFVRHFYGGGLLYRYTGERARFSSGIDYDVQADARKNFDNLNGQRGDLALDQDETVKSLGLFVSQAYQILENVELSGAVRYDRVSFDVDDAFLSDGDDSGDIRFTEWSPMLGLSWSPCQAVTLYANVSTSFETPTTTELDNPSGGGFNTGLQSQTAWNYEIGIKGERSLAGRALRYELTAFHIDIEDALVPFELAAFPGRRFYRNAGESRRQGVEAALTTELGAGWSLGLSYTWSDFRYREFEQGGQDFSGKHIPGIPEHYGALRLDYAHPGGFFAGWRTRLVGSFYADDANNERIEAYSVSDLRFGYTHTAGSWTIEPYLAVNNILDESYFGNIRINARGGRHFEPAPERSLFGGIRVRYDFR
ncbi:MAG: TonB-dependent receptor [Puniceicoccaceae bacterium]|nr:MAG: TonB-dependent receptor [Puniceicoccaceae bacterium]